MERRLAAILAADVVGYSRLIRAGEEGTLVRLNRMWLALNSLQDRESASGNHNTTNLTNMSHIERNTL